MKNLFAFVLAMMIAALTFAQTPIRIVASGQSGQIPQTLVSALVDSIAALRAFSNTKQLSDADLTAIAGLSPTNDDIIQRKSGSWTNRTMAQLKSDLGVSGSNTGDQDLSGLMVKTNNLSDITDAATSRTNLGATTVGNNLFILPNPGVVSFAKINADNTITARTPSQVLSDINAQAADADLTTLAGLPATTDNFIVGVSSAWASRTPAQVRTTLGLVISTDVQAYDPDLTTWSGITPGTGVGTFLATPSSANLLAAMTNKTGTGVLVFGTQPDFTTSATIGGVAIPTISSPNTISNKRFVARTGSTTSSATPTINTDNVDIYKITALAANITSFTTNLSGTPNDGDVIEIQITDNGTARTITWGASFVSSTVTLPSTTVAGVTLTVIAQYYSNSSYGNNKWVCANSY